jgi:hypothetical protein
MSGDENNKRVQLTDDEVAARDELQARAKVALEQGTSVLIPVQLQRFFTMAMPVMAEYHLPGQINEPVTRKEPTP